MAAISSLGLGSGTLTSDVIDKLKAADESAIIKPIQKNATKTTTKQTDLATFTALLSSLKSAAYDLGTDTAYLQRTASSSSTAVKISATDGAQIQNATMSVTQLAKNDIVQSSGFSTSTSIVSLSSGTLTLKLGTSKSYEIGTTVGMTLEQLAQSITDTTDGNIKASILNTGDATTPYRLILKTKDSGEDNRLYISEDSISTSLGLETPSIEASSSASTTTTSLVAGDIKINGISIGAVSTSSSSDAETNALELATAINLKTADTGVQAITDGSGKLKLISDGRGIGLELSAGAQTATGFSSQYLVSDTESYTATGTAAVSDTTIATGDIKINGTSIAGASLLSTNTAEQNAQLLVTAINSSKSTTGVTALTDGAGKLMLYAADGKDISIVLQNSASTYTGLAASDSTITATENNKLQNAQDAELTYDGISITRSSNTITDLMSGVTLTLVKTTADADDGDAEISIEQDTSKFSTYAESFVKAFNDVSSKLQELTKYDPATGQSGTFVGVSEISGIYSSMSSILTSYDTDGNSIMSYGFSMDKNGQISIDTEVLQEKVSEDSEALEKLFKGSSVITDASYTANNAATTTSGSTSPLGSITINGIAISSVTTTSTDAESNAQLFVSAINSVYSETGVKAYTNGSGKIKLTNDIGGKIQLTTTAFAASLSGLSADVGSDTAMTNSTVAYGDIQSKNGIFANFNEMLKKLYSNNDSTLKVFDNSLSDQLKRISEEQTTAQERLDSRYELLTSRFAMYDSIIAKYQQQFSSLQMQINQAMG